MAEINYKEFKICDLFENVRGLSKYTKNYCNQHIGEFEVFTGTTIGSFAFIDTYDYTVENLSYTTDGEKAGTLQILKGKYSIGGHRAILVPIIENIDIEYFRIVLQPLFFSNVKRGDVPTLNWSIIKNLPIFVPIDESNNIDVELQRYIVQKNNSIFEKKKELQNKLNYINTVELNFLEEHKINIIELDFNEIFVLKRGKVISKTFIQNNKGDNPVYSTQLDKPFGYINTYMYDGEYLIWNTDGLGGYIRHVMGKFSITNIVGIMLLKDEYKEKVNLEYVRRILQPIFRQNTKGRGGLNGKNEYTKLNSTMIEILNIKIPIPLHDNGEIDIEKQNLIVKKYNNITEIKKKLNEEIEKVLNIDIRF